MLAAIDARSVDMMRKLKATIIGVALVLASLGEPASSETANYRMPGCRSFAKQDNDSRYLFASGVCSGLIEALISLTPALAPEIRSCPPSNITTGQGALVVVQFIDARPARLNDGFLPLAIEAFQNAWPC